MSDALPVPRSSEPAWERFSADPRTAGGAAVRASHADRDLVAEILAEAYASGRLDDFEHRSRLDQAMGLKTIGEVMPLVRDLLPTAARLPAMDRAAQAPVQKVLTGSALSVILIVNVVWLLTCLTTGQLNYYWPMWPMAAMIIPLVIARFSGRDQQ